MPVNKVSRSPVSVINQQELSRLMKVADLHLRINQHYVSLVKRSLRQ